MFKLLSASLVTGLAAVCLAVGLHPATAARAQQAQAPVSIRTQSSEVLVDAIVSDKKNRIVTNLKPEDFAVYEDGVRQQVTSVRFVNAAATVPPPVRGTRTETPSAQPATPVSVPEAAPSSLPTL